MLAAGRGLLPGSQLVIQVTRTDDYWLVHCLQYSLLRGMLQGACYLDRLSCLQGRRIFRAGVQACDCTDKHV